VNGIMTTTLERLTGSRLVQALIAAVLAALFVLAAAGMAAADGYGGNYPADGAPGGGQAPPAATSSGGGGDSSSLPVTGSDVLGLAALGVGVAGAGVGLVHWTRRRAATGANA
jgi:LPXTG-motif cell wall-anchored protein